MLRPQAIKIPKLGTFTFDHARKPVLVLLPEFMSAAGSRPGTARSARPGTLPTTTINYFAVGTTVHPKQSKDVVHAVVKGVVRAMGSQSKRGQAVELEFGPAGTLQLRPSRAHGMVHKFAFNPRLAGPQRTARSRPATAAANKPASRSRPPRAQGNTTKREGRPKVVRGLCWCWCGCCGCCGCS